MELTCILSVNMLPEQNATCIWPQILYIFYFPFRSVSNASIANYVRHVFSMVLGILALTGSLVVLFCQPPMLCSTRRGW